ncbi:hypothetical protein [Pedobacter frigoris]|uniref:Uncharacterized protein n=1 Tax=Pedobacter frigoris TaxID=2571272 RepID=A0A4U1CQJ5_9SPHI|nr:hypothetical protein [Pedobacter frigoris]TKC09095.1 hypothetical protein FA047_03095 [Pedobacter frigoris]
MLSKLNYVQKNKLLLPLLVAGLLLCWFLAFSKTFDAIKLNHKLNDDSSKNSDISFNPVYTQRKLSALNEILKGYKVAGQWNDQLWMQSSAIAAKNGVAVDFTLNKPGLEPDSTQVGQSQTLYFHGRFVQLVKVIDTLESLKGIGRISGLKIRAPKADAEGDKQSKSELRVDFRAGEIRLN